jgi:gluconolactonase
MKVDGEGRVYGAAALGIWVFEPDGKLLGIIATPKRPANLAWCNADAHGLAITAVDAVYQLRLKVPGILPPFTS